MAIPSAACDELDAIRRRVLTQNLARRAAAREVAEALDHARIPFIVLKGVALAEELYGDLSLRGFNDLDVMVPMDRIEAACSLARRLGYGLVRFTDVRDWMRVGAHAAGMARRDGYGLDLHWTIGPELPANSPDVVWKHVVPAPAGASLPGLRLSNEMAAVHLAKHFHTGQYCLLKPLVDFHFATRGSLDEQDLERIGRALGLSSVVKIARVVSARALDGKRMACPGTGLARHVVSDALLVDAMERSRVSNWARYLVAAGGAGYAAREMARIFFPGRLALAIFFNAPFRPRMYPAYYWRQLVKVLTLSSK
jgi:hypothetical protein